MHAHSTYMYMYSWTHAHKRTHSYTHRGTYPSRASRNPPPCLKPDLSACSAEFSNRPDFWPLPFLAVHRREDEVPKPLSSLTQKIPCSSSPPTHERTHTNIVDTHTLIPIWDVLRPNTLSGSHEAQDQNINSGYVGSRYVCACMYVCVFVCMCWKETERER